MAGSDFQYAVLLQKQFEHESKDINNTMDDSELAFRLQQQFEQEASTENPKSLVYGSKKAKDSNKSLIDPSWEVIDPTPDIHVLFVTFNQRFFWNKLLTVCVSWSKRMTSCAGICSYQGRGGMCSITLSEPLLKLRPRKDLIETLLHEMIHAYLFVTDNNRDRDGHGPEFHKHMWRINNEAGTKITVYHSFHDEVRLYKQHWWRCNGPCQNQKPYFGMVKRAMNRAPGPNDRWWSEHSRNCGGEFIKVKEPEKKQKSTNKENQNKNPPQKNEIAQYFPVLQNKSTGNNIHGFDNTGNIKNINNTSMKKNSASTVVLTKTKTATKDTKQTDAVVPSKNIVGGAILQTKNPDYSLVRNHWINKFHGDNDKKRVPNETINTKNKKVKVDLVTCPVCNEEKRYDEADTHIDDCLRKYAEEKAECVICSKLYPKSDLQQHVLQCLGDDDDYEVSKNDSEASYSNSKDDNEIGNKRQCPICAETVDDQHFDLHAANCLHKLYDAAEKRNSKDEGENFRHEFESTYLDDETEKKHSCPFCFKMFFECEMADHLTECIKHQVDNEEQEENRSILLDELNNVDF